MTMAATPGQALLTVGIEAVAVGAFTIIAGISDEAAHVVMIFMAGLWILFLIGASSSLKTAGNVVTNIEKLA